MIEDGSVWWPTEGGRRLDRVAFSYTYEEERAQALARHDATLLQQYFRRRGREFSGLATVLEFGLGLTRGSDWLAQAGPLIVTDIAEAEVQAARARLGEKAPWSLSFRVLEDRRGIADLPPLGLLYSTISLGHARAAVHARVIEGLLEKVVPGGTFLLRAPTQHKHYQYALPGAPNVAELDVIPQWDLFEMLRAWGFTLILAQEEPLLQAADLLYTKILAEKTS